MSDWYKKSFDMGEEVVKNSEKRADVFTLWTAHMYIYIYL